MFLNTGDTLMDKRVVVLLTSLLFSIAPGVLANERDIGSGEGVSWNTHRGVYVEAGPGINAFYALLPSGSKGTIRGFGMVLSLGYGFANNIAIESGFIYSSDLNAGVDASVVGINLVASASAKLYIPYLAFRFNVPIGDRYGILFKLGGMYPYASAKLSASATGIQKSGRIAGDRMLPFTGIGMGYAIMPKLDFTVMYQGAVYVMASGAVLGAELTYHFS